jgi:hypothetical protein
VWTDVTAPLSTDEIRQGVVDEITGTSWGGDDRLAFYDAGVLEGFVGRRGGLPEDSRVILLFSKDDAEVRSAALPDRWREAVLDSTLDGMTALRGVPDPQEDATLLELFDVRVEHGRAISFDGGLKYEGVYLKSALPMIRVEGSATHVMVDDMQRRVLPDGRILFDVPLDSGLHIIKCGDEIRRFYVADGEGLPDSADCDSIGVILERKHAFRTSNVELIRSSPYMVGGYLAESSQ